MATLQCVMSENMRIEPCYQPPFVLVQGYVKVVYRCSFSRHIKFNKVIVLQSMEDIVIIIIIDLDSPVCGFFVSCIPSGILGQWEVTSFLVCGGMIRYRQCGARCGIRQSPYHVS